MNEKFIFYINWLLGSKRTIRNLKYMGYQEKKIVYQRWDTISFSPNSCNLNTNLVELSKVCKQGLKQTNAYSSSITFFYFPILQVIWGYEGKHAHMRVRAHTHTHTHTHRGVFWHFIFISLFWFFFLVCQSILGHVYCYLTSKGQKMCVWWLIYIPKLPPQVWLQVLHYLVHNCILKKARLVSQHNLCNLCSAWCKYVISIFWTK